MEKETLTFRDRWVTDEEGNTFIFTVEMQRRLSQNGLPVEVGYLEQLDNPPERDTGVREEAEAPPEPRQETRQREPQRESKPAPKPEEPVEPASIQIDPMTGKYVGRVKWFNARKGYGFILRGAGEEIFFHRSNTAGDPEELEEGQWILYDVEETKKGPEATDVEPYEGEIPEL